MTTTRALGGRAGLGMAPGMSVIALDVLEEVLEAGGGEAAGRALEAFHRPGPEVVVDRARRVLDRAPQRRPVPADQAAEQPGARDLAAPRPAVVGRDQVFQGLFGELRLGGDVAELEAGVVVAGQLVVDQPDPLPVVDEVRGQQVVVARDRTLGADRERLLGRGEPRRQVVVAGRDPEAAGPGHGQVPALDGEHVEVVAEPGASVQPAARRGDARDVLFAGYVGRPERPALDVADDQQAVLGAVLDHRRAGPGGGRGQRVPVLAVPVDGQQLAAGSRDARDEGPVRGGHLVVAVGQPAGQLADRAGLAGQAVRLVEEGVEVRGNPSSAFWAWLRSRPYASPYATWAERV